jgi:hypothetical protein
MSRAKLIFSLAALELVTFKLHAVVCIVVSKYDSGTT